ncbi:hypothetical protein EJ03DRAFT_349734 [Teratosphaeria nubilosa]|uniref:Uncharacterized protein n=1 Tax=Teratosphaeria nubilosa TaxID=161662 RepID=A0A6G1LFF8_9PEZI|nr:hypothetical protein EJ03DRAFT_349734 [Teratosphaeria nubilosa]
MASSNATSMALVRLPTPATPLFLLAKAIDILIEQYAQSKIKPPFTEAELAVMAIFGDICRWVLKNFNFYRDLAFEPVVKLPPYDRISREHVKNRQPCLEWKDEMYRALWTLGVPIEATGPSLT